MIGQIMGFYWDFRLAKINLELPQDIDNKSHKNQEINEIEDKIRYFMLFMPFLKI